MSSLALSLAVDVTPWLLAGGSTSLAASRYGLIRLPAAAIRRDWQTCRSATQAARIVYGWPALARHLGLALIDRTGDQPRVRVPRLRVRPDGYGVVVDARTVHGVGLAEWQRAAPHLADAWGATRVSVEQVAPGRIRVRAVRRDPLTVVTSWSPDPDSLTAPDDLSSLPIGTDEYGAPVSLRLSGVPGIGIYGLPGYGKTSLINGVITRLSPSPAVQFVILDGKADDPTEGDYGGVASRASILAGDDVEQAADILGRLVEMRRARSRSITSILGTRNAWQAGFTPDWPLIITIIDEAHTYFSQVKSNAPMIKKRNESAAMNAWHVEDLIKKGRSVGMITLLATQKGTGDAIPTAIRDVCPVSVAFGCRTAEAAVAALGDDIRQHPHASPVALQDPAYVGVATMVVPGRPGYTRVRMPYVSDDTTASVAQLHHGLVLTPGDLPPVPAATVPALDGVATDD